MIDIQTGGGRLFWTLRTPPHMRGLHLPVKPAPNGAMIDARKKPTNNAYNSYMLSELEALIPVAIERQDTLMECLLEMVRIELLQRLGNGTVAASSPRLTRLVRDLEKPEE